jgi:drug/metabolite transporter (DMT)-like permease
VDPQQFGVLAAAITAFLWTLSTLAWTSAGRYVGAVAVSFVRLAITCVFLVAYGGLVRGLWFPTDATPWTWWLLGLSGLSGFFVCDLCLFKALLLIGPRLTLLIQALSPPLTAVISWFWLGEPLSETQWLAMTVTVAGVVWVVLERGEHSGQKEGLGIEDWGLDADGQPQSAASQPPVPNPQSPIPSPTQSPIPGVPHRTLGLWLAVAAAGAGAVGTVLGRQAVMGSDYDPFAANFIRIIGAMVVYLPAITLARRWTSIALGVAHGRAMVIMICGSLVGPFLGVALYMLALQHVAAGVTATIVNTTPVLILPFAVLFYHEKVTLRAAGGAALSVAGIALLAL